MRQMAQISTPSPTQQSKMDSFQLIKSKMESQKVRKSARERERERLSQIRGKKREERKKKTRLAINQLGLKVGKRWKWMKFAIKKVEDDKKKPNAKCQNMGH